MQEDLAQGWADAESGSYDVAQVLERELELQVDVAHEWPPLAVSHE